VSGHIDATTVIDLPGNTRYFLGQCYEGRRIVGIREPPLVGGQTPHVVHLAEELTGKDSYTLWPFSTK
jgi:hypothetical protein